MVRRPKDRETTGDHSFLHGPPLVKGYYLRIAEIGLRDCAWCHRHTARLRNPTRPGNITHPAYVVTPIT